MLSLLFFASADLQVSSGHRIHVSRTFLARVCVWISQWYARKMNQHLLTACVMGQNLDTGNIKVSFCCCQWLLVGGVCVCVCVCVHVRDCCVFVSDCNMHARKLTILPV